MRRAATLALSLLACVHTQAADETRTQVEQRLRLAARLLADPAMTQRLNASGDATAVEHLGQGRMQQALAEDALQRNDLATARRAVDEALRHLGTARRRVPDGATQQAAARQRQQQMLASLERVVDSLYGGAAPPEVRDGDVDAALSLMETARHFAAGGRHDQALFTLGLAERHMQVAVQRIDPAREVDYTQRAASPQQEFKLELQRHEGLAELVPLALRELRPSGAALALIERYRDTGRSLREQALQQAERGDLPGALEQVRQASVFVQRALQAAGVAMPQAAGAPP